jgi:hypothetical protein
MTKLAKETPIVIIKKNSRLTPSTTAGVARGAVKSELRAPFPGKLYLTKASEHGIASRTATEAAIVAREKVTIIELRKTGLLKKKPKRVS